MAREQFSTRLGFILITAGCAIGLGNVWRFPFITGQYGGAVFVIIYICFLLLVGVPLLTVELAVGRASRQSIGRSFEQLKPGSKWRYNKYYMILGNYVLMAFYSLVAGWMLYYTVKVASGSFGGGMQQAESGAAFGELLNSPGIMLICMLAISAGAFIVCGFGLRRGVERITKPLMLFLFVLMIALALRSFSLPGFKAGISYFLMPNLDNLQDKGILTAVSAAMGQAFFTLGLGVGSIQIFGSYMQKSKSIGHEAVLITGLDTCVGLLAGLIIFPACFSYAVEPGQGPGLLFITLVTVFSNMENGALWGGLFFMFMLIAAFSTLVAVYENIIAICMEVFNLSRVKSTIANFCIINLLALPCLFGYNLLSDIHPLGGESTILDTYDFVLSQNILPFGAMCYILFIALDRGWGFDNYLKETNSGSGIKISPSLRWYYRILLPAVIAVLFFQGYAQFFS